MLAVKLLGQFEVQRDGTLLAIPSRAAQSLLAHLLLTVGTTHRREELAGFLWPDTADENARSNLRHELWRLRKLIEAKKPGPRTVPYILVDEIAIGFNPQSDYRLDVALLQQPAAKKTSADKLIETLALYRGELLPGWYDDWVLLERERVRAVFEGKMARLLELLVEGKRWPDTLAWGERWIALGQTPEPAYRALMVAHGANGNVSQVAAVYERCVQAMRGDLGVEPSAQTRKLFEQLSKDHGISKISEPRASQQGEQTNALPATPGELIAAPSQTSRPRSSNLPIPLTSFVGREREIEQVKRMLSSTRLLTLTGAGGVGKTRLAIQLAADLQSQFRDGPVWVDLVALTDPAVLPQSIAKELGLREAPNVALSETLADALCISQVLLVLDNCEHMVAACAQLADTLLGACTSLKILTTSREALGVTGETTWRVPSLSLPKPGQPAGMKNLDQYESVRLFVERARAVRSDFAPTDQNALPIVQICQRLDGIPLAIELAAARIKTLAVDQIAARLDDRFKLLTRGSRTALPRQQTLRALIDWSYDLLSEVEQTMLRRLSVFTGGRSLEAAEAVCAGNGLEPGQIMELVARLVDKSLLEVEEKGGASRYRMLDTIRQYARGKLIESGEAETVHGRHLDYFLNFAEGAAPKLHGMEQSIWLNRVDVEHDNLRAALEWAWESGRDQAALDLTAALWKFWEVRGYFGDSRVWLERAVESHPDAPVPIRVQVLHGLGRLDRFQGRYAEGRVHLEECLALYRKLGSKVEVADVFQILGEVAAEQGDLAEASRRFEEAMTIGLELGDRSRLAGIYLSQGEVARVQGNYDSAGQLYTQSLALLESLGDDRRRGIALYNLGQVALHQGDLARAAGLFRSSLTVAQKLANKLMIAHCVAALAGVAGAAQQLERAARLRGAAEALFASIGAKLDLADRLEDERSQTLVRGVLDEKTFSAAYAQGRAMSMEQAAAYGLEDEPVA